MRKRCTKCGEDKSLEQFSKGKSANQFGLRAGCKACESAYRVANVERDRARSARRYQRDREKARVYGSARYAANRATIRARQAVYASENAAAILAQRARYRSTRRAELSAKSVEWARNNPDLCNARNAARRARTLLAPGDGITGTEWRGIRAAALGLCAYCNEPRRLTMDHIEPLSRGGAHDPENVAGACDTCNKSKSDTPLLVWLARRAAA